MTASKFMAMVVEEDNSKRFTRKIKAKSLSDLPEGEVLIKVHYSSLNYKDALSATGNKGVTRRFPHTPGIDAAGEVVDSVSDQWHKGDAVLVTGYDLGMNTSGGFGQYIRVPAGWVVALPENVTPKESMIFGTAGFTAALSLYKLMQTGVRPEDGDVLVTGASGGVGSLAVALLAHNGYSVVAASGKPHAKEILMAIGAKEIIGREAVRDATAGALLAQRWAGVIDTVGGDILAYALRSTQRHGVVTCCGNVASAELHLTVYPFILRGLTLCGVDSATSDMAIRQTLWHKLGAEWKIAHLEKLATEIGLNDLGGQIDKILAGQQMGRCVVNLDL
jgi:acrylyl-CoA reductase (NADPH)